MESTVMYYVTRNHDFDQSHPTKIPTLKVGQAQSYKCVICVIPWSLELGNNRHQYAAELVCVSQNCSVKLTIE